jgi:hypothetical protein
LKTISTRPESHNMSFVYVSEREVCFFYAYILRVIVVAHVCLYGYIHKHEHCHLFFILKKYGRKYTCWAPCIYFTRDFSKRWRTTMLLFYKRCLSRSQNTTGDCFCSLVSHNYNTYVFVCVCVVEPLLSLLYTH